MTLSGFCAGVPSLATLGTVVLRIATEPHRTIGTTTSAFGLFCLSGLHNSLHFFTFTFYTSSREGISSHIPLREIRYWELGKWIGNPEHNRSHPFPSMPYNPDLHHRRSIRLKGYDYSSSGAYFVTLCTCDRICWFGEVVDGEMRLNQLGQVVADTWQWLAVQHPYIELDEWIVMPNHFHGILVITDIPRTGGSRTAPTLDTAPHPSNTAPHRSNTAPHRSDTTPHRSDTAPTLATTPHRSDTTQPPDDRTKIKPLGRLIGAFKTVSTKQINQIRQTPGTFIWQRNYYEHIVRDENRLRQIRQYIANNPNSWQQDQLHSNDQIAIP